MNESPIQVHLRAMVEDGSSHSLLQSPSCLAAHLKIYFKNRGGVVWQSLLSGNPLDLYPGEDILPAMPQKHRW